MQRKPLGHDARRGAAGVSIVWMISVIVLFFVALAFAFVTSGDQQKAVLAQQAAEQERDEAITKAAEERSKTRNLSTVLGFYDRNAATADANPATAKEALESLKASFPDMGPTVANYEDAIPGILARVSQLQRQLDDADQTIRQLRGEVQARDSQISQVSGQKDQEITTLRTNLTDTEQAASNRQTELQGQLSSARADLSSRDQQVRDEQTKLERMAREKRDELSAKDSRISTLVDQLAVITDEPETADGQVLSYSQVLGLGFIDLGNKNRLALGTRFRVVDGTPGAERVKAWAEVVGVDNDMAQVKFFDVRDPFDPPTAGDVVLNPIYDPKSTRYAILVGRFSGTYSEADLRALLGEMNIKVQESLDLTTDYMIVGAELYQDEEGEPLEEPIPASETLAYKEAVAQGVQVVPLKDIRAYFSPR